MHTIQQMQDLRKCSINSETFQIWNGKTQEINRRKNTIFPEMNMKSKILKEQLVWLNA